jgi:RHS repeat-associated protein
MSYTNSRSGWVRLSTGTIVYLVADSLGSVRGAVASSGSLSGSVDYDAWGNPETAGGLSSYTPFGFAGAYTDPSGMVYLIGRYYDPQTGQFLSVDSLVNETGQPYAYTGDDPVNGIDPLGLCWPSFECGVEHAIGGAATSAWNASGGQVVHYVDQHGTAIGLIVAGVVVVAGATVLTGGLADAAFLAADAAAEEGAAASLEFNMTILAHGAFVFGPGLLAGGFGLASIGYGAWQLATARSVALPRCPS